MGNLNYLDFDPNEFGENESEWTVIEVGNSKEKLIWIELTDDEQIIIMSNKRNVYMSSDQGVTFESQGQINHLEYWHKRIKGQWQHLVIFLEFLINRFKLYGLKGLFDWSI